MALASGQAKLKAYPTECLAHIYRSHPFSNVDMQAVALLVSKGRESMPLATSSPTLGSP